MKRSRLKAIIIQIIIRFIIIYISKNNNKKRKHFSKHPINSEYKRY